MILILLGYRPAVDAACPKIVRGVKSLEATPNGVLADIWFVGRVFYPCTGFVVR